MIIAASLIISRIPPLETILSATNRKQIAIDLNNRPENDFNTLSLTITDWADSLDKSKFPQDLFVSLRPRSFYKSLNVATTADLGYCFTCLHFLENIPTYLDCHFTATRSQKTTQSIRNQAHLDLQKFLRHPATEFVPGGQLLLSFIASGFGHPDLFDSRPGECSRLAILEIDAEGRLPPGTLERLVILVYYRSEDDVRSTIDSQEASECWEMVSMTKSEVMHPCGTSWRRRRRWVATKNQTVPSM